MKTVQIPKFSLHSLIFGVEITPDTFQKMAQDIRRFSHVPTGVELAFHPALLDSKIAPTLAQISRDTQVPITALCIFFDEDGPDPIGLDDNPQQAMYRLRSASEFASVIGSITGITPFITGPWAYQIGKPYPRTEQTWRNVSQFVHTAGHILNKDFPGVKRALEVLRPPENFAIQGHQRLADILLHADVNTGVHLDTFHANLWGDDDNIQALLDMCGPRLFWLHVSGKDRRTPGSHVHENTNWSAWARAFNQSPAKPGICFEGFGPTFRSKVPAIGDGFPKEDIEPEESVQTALETLTRAGFILE